MLTRPQDQTSDDAPIQGVERDPIQAHQAVGAGIVADAATRAKLGAGLPLLGSHRLDGLNRLGAGTAGELRAQSVGQAGFPLHPVMSRVGVGDALLPAHLGHPRSRLVESLLRGRERRVMAVTIKLDADDAGECVVHKSTIADGHPFVTRERRRRFLPRLKPGGSAPDFL